MILCRCEVGHMVRKPCPRAVTALARTASLVTGTTAALTRGAHCHGHEDKQRQVAGRQTDIKGIAWHVDGVDTTMVVGDHKRSDDDACGGQRGKLGQQRKEDAAAWLAVAALVAPEHDVGDHGKPSHRKRHNPANEHEAREVNLFASHRRVVIVETRQGAVLEGNTSERVVCGQLTDLRAEVEHAPAAPTDDGSSHPHHRDAEQERKHAEKNPTPRPAHCGTTQRVAKHHRGASKPERTRRA